MKNLLLVDNKPDSAVLSAQLIAKYPQVQVVTAKSGADALQKAAEIHPDLIITNFSLIGLSGIEVCKQLKAQVQLQPLPVVMFNCHTTIEDMVAAYDANADYYIFINEKGQQVLEGLVEQILISPGFIAN
jgi:response regulator RpfG family c-di-GMP phosphodiesterase